MKKQTTTGYYVRIDPQYLGNLGYAHVSEHLIEPDDERRLARYRKMCVGIANMVENLPDVGTAAVRADRENVCSYCGAIWEGSDSRYNNGCCDEDQRDYEEQLGVG